MLARRLVSVALATAFLGCAQPSSSDAKATPAAASDSARPAARPSEHHMYKLDYTLTITDADKPSSTVYTLNVEEGSTGEIGLGRNIPLQASGAAPSSSVAGAPSAPRTMGVPRQDVGLRLRCSFALSGEDLLLHSDLEMSGTDQGSAPAGTPVAIRKITLKGDALVAPGKASVVSSSEEPASHQRYQLTVVATKLR